VAGALAFAGSLACSALGPRLGHWQTSATIASALGARVEGERCSVVYPRSLRLADMQRFARDCDAHVAAGERWLGAPGPPRITAFVFESAAQKGALMGAADTFIAKPWRREVYVQAQSYPHPVLGHEIAHVLAGSSGRGPFRVAGSLGGLIPDPGLIEGVAVAAEPREGDLSPREWARAMKDLKLLPSLDRLFALGFLGENAGVAYTVSGAFVGWVHDRFGAAAVRAWYGGRPLPEVTGVLWADLEREWHADLDQVTLPEAARAQAKARFSRPALFARRCPHVVDGCKERANHLAASGDHGGAIAAFEQVLALDPHDDGARIAIARNRIKDGAIAEGRAELERLVASAAVPRHLRDRALEELADLALAAGEGEAAAARYRELQSRTVDEDVLRTLDVKIAAAGDERARPAVVALLVGTGGRPPDRAAAMELLRDWAVAPAQDGGAADGLSWYLLGRQHFTAGQLDEARIRLDRALAASIRMGRVRTEAERLRMVIACALGDGAGAARFYAMYAAHPEIGEARREGARALLGRCYDGGSAGPGR
jgi:tetratricopeptide (TPR) repeat protein